MRSTADRTVEVREMPECGSEVPMRVEEEEVEEAVVVKEMEEGRRRRD
jgi:hypothetical protein